MRILALSLVFAAAVLQSRADVEFLWGVSGAHGAASKLYVLNASNGKLVSTAGNVGVNCLSGLDVKNGALLAVQGQLSPTGASSKHLYRVNTSTPSLTTLATLDPKYAISDVALRPSDGTLFAFGIGVSVKKLLTVNTTTGAITEIGAMNNIQNVCMTFSAGGVLYLARTNALFTVNTTTAVTTLVAAITGATSTIDNFMATRSNGAIYVGDRVGAGTNLFTIDPATAVTTFVGTASGVQLSGIAFDTAAPPTFAVSGKKKIKTSKSKVTLKGTAKSKVPLTISTKGGSTVAKNGKWSLKLKLKKGKNKFKLLCDDGLGQKKQTTVTVIRE